GTSPVDWGGTVTVRYTITNRGPGDAAPFNAELRLSADGIITDMDVPLSSVAVGGLPAGPSFSGSTTVHLPGSPGRPPPGFDQAAGHPTLQFNAQGRAFVSFMAAKFFGPLPAEIYPDGGRDNGVLRRSYGMQASNGIFVAGSTVNADGSLSWNAPVGVTANTFTPGGPKVFFDAIPALAIDTFATLPGGTTANPKLGNLYVTWTRAFP